MPRHVVSMDVCVYLCMYMELIVVNMGIFSSTFRIFFLKEVQLLKTIKLLKISALMPTYKCPPLPTQSLSQPDFKLLIAEDTFLNTEKKLRICSDSQSKSLCFS